MLPAKTYFRLPCFFTSFKYRNIPIIHIPKDHRKDYAIERSLLHLYKRFLRLSSLIEISDTTISKVHYRKLFLTMIRTRLKANPMKLFHKKLILVSDIDISFKLKLLREKYHALEVEEQTAFLQQIDNNLLNNYHFFSINQFVRLYELVCKSINKKDFFLMNMLNQSVNILENPELLQKQETNNYNSLLFGTALNLKHESKDSKHRKARYNWKSLFNEISASENNRATTLSQQQYDYFEQLRNGAHLSFLKNEKNRATKGSMDNSMFYTHLIALVNSKESKKHSSLFTNYICNNTYKSGYDIVDYINGTTSNTNQMLSNFTLTHQFILSQYFKQKIVIPYITEKHGNAVERDTLLPDRNDLFKKSSLDLFKKVVQ